MLFNSFLFIFFFSIVAIVLAFTNCDIIVNNITPEKIYKLRHIILLIASFVFYGCWNISCCLLLFGVSLSGFITALQYERTKKKGYALVGVILPLVVLAIFKYYNFFMFSFFAIFHLKKYDAISIILPVGISFYTFQAVSYVVDVYRGQVKAEKSFLKVALYIAFFPQLVAGPIVKAKDFMFQLYEDRNISFERIKSGIQIFIFGLFKKIVLADNISVYVDAIYANPREWSSLTLIMAVIGYAIQIYCDFSGANFARTA